MTPEIQEVLEQQAELSITTYDAEGKPGTVPIWFVYEAGKVYMATGRSSRKVSKLQANPWVRLTFSRKNGPSLVGRGRICSDGDQVRRVAPILNSKYGGAWGPDVQMIHRLLGRDIVLLEITLLPRA